MLLSFNFNTTAKITFTSILYLGAPEISEADISKCDEIKAKLSACPDTTRAKYVLI